MKALTPSGRAADPLAQNVAEQVTPEVTGMRPRQTTLTCQSATPAFGTWTRAEPRPTAAAVVSHAMVPGMLGVNCQSVVTSFSKPGFSGASGPDPIQIIWLAGPSGWPSQPVLARFPVERPLARSTAYSSYHQVE